MIFAKEMDDVDRIHHLLGQPINNIESIPILQELTSRCVSFPIVLEVIYNQIELLESKPIVYASGYG